MTGGIERDGGPGGLAVALIALALPVDQFAAVGFNWVWFLGVWQTGPVGRQVSLSDSELLLDYQRALPDFDQSDVCGSCFSVRSYTVHSDLGGDKALQRLSSPAE